MLHLLYVRGSKTKGEEGVREDGVRRRSERKRGLDLEGGRESEQDGVCLCVGGGSG